MRRRQTCASLLEPRGLAGWDDFADSWNDLGVDTYMADGGRYRRRRYAAFSVGAAGTRRKPHQPHYQSRDYNPLNGGIARWFEPIKRDIGDHRRCRRSWLPATTYLSGCTPPETRPDILACRGASVPHRPARRADGKPTPEGLHRDGVDWVLVLLVRRQNVASGETSIHDLRQRHLGSFTLSEPLEAAWVDDDRVYHGVTPVTPIDPGEPAYRDVLVVTFRRE